jgi:cytochrome c-type protein NapB
MKKLAASLTAVLALALVASLSTGAAAQQDGAVQSLRGATGIDEINEAPPITRQNTGRRFDRAYRQQPPMIPHKTDTYQINSKVNQCLRCHDWPYNVREGAPKVSETHYVDRNGIALDKVTSSRWFCNQCHVTQEDAPALVGNTFRNSVNNR